MTGDACNGFIALILPVLIYLFLSTLIFFINFIKFTIQVVSLTIWRHY